MTLEQATQRAQAAVDAGDLDQLREALRARAAAIAQVSEPERLKNALREGERIARDLHLLRSQLSSVRAAFLAGYGNPDA
jgi:putative ubiquitin-RnfH superfamily antitoxin RatB of RatAB toxin-antitoxin module